MIDELLWGSAQDFHNAGELFNFVLAREERIAGVKFGKDAAQTPHVDGRTIRKSQDHFGASVKPRLNVRVDTLMTVARRAKIYHFDRTAASLL